MKKKWHRKQKVCCICRNELCANDRKYQKDRDCLHCTEKYRGAAHDICNLRYKNNKRNSCSFS